MFYDNYKDTGVPQTTSYTYQRSSVGLPACRPHLQGPHLFFNTPRVQIPTRTRRSGTSSTPITCTRSPVPAIARIEGGPRLPAHEQRRGHRVSRRVRLHLLEHSRSRTSTALRQGTRHVRVLPRRRHRHVRQRQRRHPVAVRSGLLERDRAADGQSGSQNREGAGADLQPDGPEVRVRVRLRRQARAASGGRLRRARRRPQ